MRRLFPLLTLFIASVACGDGTATSDDSSQAGTLPSVVASSDGTPNSEGTSPGAPGPVGEPALSVPVNGNPGPSTSGVEGAPEPTEDETGGANGDDVSGGTDSGGSGNVPEPAASGAGGQLGGAGPVASGGAAGTSTTPSSGCGQAVETGTFQRTIEAFGLERGYFLSVPDSYDPDVPQRLFFGYHGSGWNGQMMRGYLDLEEPPLLDGSLFVYPDGLPRGNNPDGLAEWELDPDGRDIAFFDALYAELTASYCIDEQRVFVNGQSFGGLMTNAVGCARGNLVRAIAVVAGSGPRNNSCQGQVAAWLTHGEDDESVSFQSGEASRDHWVEANHCSSTTTPGTPAQCQNYEGCDPAYPVIWCPHVDDGGHQHPSFGREAVRQFFDEF